VVVVVRGDNVVRKCGFQTFNERFLMGRLCCRVVAGDIGGLGSETGTVTLVYCRQGHRWQDGCLVMR
jgi:hypothetical protein